MVEDDKCLGHNSDKMNIYELRRVEIRWAIIIFICPPGAGINLFPSDCIVTQNIG